MFLMGPLGLSGSFARVLVSNAAHLGRQASVRGLRHFW